MHRAAGSHFGSSWHREGRAELGRAGPGRAGPGRAEPEQGPAEPREFHADPGRAAQTEAI